MNWPGPRKVVCYREEIVTEHGRSPAVTTTRASAAAVITNPWLSSNPTTDLSEAARRIAPHLARLLTDQLIAVLGPADHIQAFGKAAVVGTAGELEHGAALIHTPYFGNLVREFLHGESIICFSDERGEAGTALAVPVWHKVAASTRSHYQTVCARIPDAPRATELMVIAAATTGPRPHPRIGDRTTDPEVRATDLEMAI